MVNGEAHLRTSLFTGVNNYSQYEDLCCDGANQFSEAAKTQMLQNILDNVVKFQMICTTAQQTGYAVTGNKPHSFENYKALVISAADAYDAKHAAKRHPIHNAFLHDLGDHNSIVRPSTWQLEQPYPPPCHCHPIVRECL